MNKHAQALYSKAVQYAFDQRFTESPEGPRELQEVINDRFLKLIVWDCSYVCEEYADRLIGNTEKGRASRDTAYMLAESIKDHFEVE